ncbi:MFS general substrate transporter [Schizopora paradoxa]|uniref:MFS general substrate transporter n=1 Tax=Schizopora paradoxa TaxID=27342 RepID=A0A0H2R963_9AGAM|nr:MFS general substrate transporter [Schizopora paradoxa]
MQEEKEFIGGDTNKTDVSESSVTRSTSDDFEANAGEDANEKVLPVDGNGNEVVDGGFWAWATVFGVWIVQFTGFGYTNAFGVYQDFYVRDFLSNKSSSQISWIGSVQVFLMMSSGIITGRLFDKGYFHRLMWIGSALVVFSLFMLSLAKPGKYYQILLSQGIAFGIGSGMTYVPSVAVLAQHFPSPHKRALVMTLVASGSSLGGVVHPIMLNNLFHGSTGFANGVRASAGMIGGLLFLVALPLMRTKYPKVTGAPTTTNTGAVNSKAMVAKFFREPVYIACIFGMVLVMSGLFFPIFYIQLDAVQRGLNSTFSFYSLTILNVASIVGRVLPGFLAKKVGIVNLVLVFAAGCAALLFSLFGVKTVGGVVAFAILFGFFSGGFVSLLPPTMALQADSPAEIGARIGIAFSFVGLGVLISTPVDGALLTKDKFLWWRPIVFSGVLSAVGTLFFLYARYGLGQRKKAGWKL